MRFPTGKILAYDDLREWMAALERAGELKTIRTEVDPVLEITEIADRVSKGSVWTGSLTGHAGLRPAGLSRRPRPAFPEHQRPSRIASFDQPVWLARRMNLALEVDASTRWPTASGLSWT